jgi:RNA polymerase primary sigma factor
VVSVARDYQEYGVPLEDLISAGNLGLITAAERFDGARGYKFISYAVWWIRNFIFQTLSLDSRMVRLPANRIKLLHRICRLSRKLAQLRESRTEARTIAEHLSVSEEMVRDTLVGSRFPKSLDSPTKGNGEPNPLRELPDDAHGLPDDDVIQDSDRKQVEMVLGTLDHREQKVLRLHFGFDGEDPMTLEEIGGHLNLTRERVRQIKEKALGKLRRPGRRAQLRPLIE